MNYLKDAIDFAMTHQNVKSAIDWRIQHKFEPIGINARFLKRNTLNPNRYLVQINFDYYDNKNNLVKEDFFIILEWIGNQYILKDGDNVTELDGYE